MRTFFMLAMLFATLLVFGCTSTPDAPVEVHEGPAYGKLRDPAFVKIVPLILPEKIDGSKDPGDEDKWRMDWPTHGATIMADGVIDGSGGHVTARAVKDKPEDGWYIEVRITRLDVGDAGKRNASAFSSSSRDGWSDVVAECRVIDAKTGEVAATCTLSHRTGSVVAYSVPFESDMNAIGKQYGDWLASR